MTLKRLSVFLSRFFHKQLVLYIKMINFALSRMISGKINRKSVKHHGLSHTQ